MVVEGVQTTNFNHRDWYIARLGNQCASRFCNLPAMPTAVCSDFVDVNIAVGDGVDGEGRDALEVELCHDVFAMGHDGGKTYGEAVGYFLVDESLGNERHYLGFTVGERKQG